MTPQRTPVRPVPLRTQLRGRIVLFLIGAVLVAAFLAVRYQRETPRRLALSAVKILETALSAADVQRLLASVRLPPSIAGRSSEDQVRFITDALRGEVSTAGIAALEREGHFGPLAEVFPGDGPRWASAAQVALQECVAFRMERGGVRAEVVLHQSPAGFRILRCNNVKQMAIVNPTTP